MTLADRITNISSRAKDQLHALGTKEKTKNALVLPFLNALGYDIFDVLEVEPGFPITVTSNEEEKVDYAVHQDGTPVMLFECMEASTDLADYDASDFFQRFQAADPKIGVMTNGIDYQFFADLGEDSITQAGPLMEFNILDHDTQDIEGLRQLTKSAFDVNTVLSAACEIQYREPLSRYITRQYENPDPEFVQFMAERIYDGEIPDWVQTRLTTIVRKALQDFAQGVSTPEPGESSPASTQQTDESASASQDEAQSSDADSEEEADEDKPYEKNLAKRVVKDF